MKDVPVDAFVDLLLYLRLYCKSRWIIDAERKYFACYIINEFKSKANDDYCRH